MRRVRRHRNEELHKVEKLNLYGTFGPYPSSRSLERILEEYNEPRYTRRVGKIYHGVTDLIKRLNHQVINCDDDVQQIIYKSLIAKYKNWEEDDLPVQVRSHLQCIIITSLRIMYDGWKQHSRSQKI